jgi:hypothetical protein
MTKATESEEAAILVGLTGTEFSEFEQLANDTNREVGQLAAWLVRLAVQRRLRVLPPPSMEGWLEEQLPA